MTTASNITCIHSMHNDKIWYQAHAFPRILQVKLAVVEIWNQNKTNRAQKAIFESKKARRAYSNPKVVV